MTQTITPLNNQQVFDAALFGIRRQDYEGSRSVEGGCAYRGQNSLKCGIGHAIPDAVYARRFDIGSHKNPTSSAILDLLEDTHPEFDPLRELFGGCDTALLEAIQAAHDGWLAPPRFVPSDPHEWESRMREIATEFNLVFTEPDDIPA